MNREEMHEPSPEQLEAVSRLNLYKLRTRDIPLLADFRRKFRWRFYRMAEAGMFMTLFSVILATAPSNPAWWVSLFVSLPLSFSVMLICEKRARQISRQLNRPAIEQIQRDINGIFD